MIQSFFWEEIMKRSLIVLTAVFLSLFAHGDTVIKPAAEDKAAKTDEERFLDYLTGKGMSYKALKEFQEDGEHHIKEGHILSVSWFDKGEIRIGMSYTLDNDGNYIFVKNLFKWEKKNVKKGKFKAKELDELKAEIKKLQDVKTPAKIGNEFFVGFRKGIRWKSSVYDVDKLPKNIKRLIFELDIAEDDSL